MGKLAAGLIVFLMLLLIVFVVDYLFIKRSYFKRITGKKKSKKKKTGDITEITYLVGKFELDKNKLPLKYLLIAISFINAFIISLVAVVVITINIHLVFQMLIGFVLLFALIYSLYELLGRYLVKKGFGK